MWLNMDNGKTIGQSGSEDGIIILDEEYNCASRITLERGGVTAPYSITCGIYGLLVHTIFADCEAEAIEKYNSVKKELQVFMDSSNDDISGEWCKQFINRW